MKLAVTIPSLVAFVLLLGHASPSAATRYDFIDGAAGDQNGHTLQGWIEFDLACGTACTTSNVLDFSFTVSGPSNYMYSYAVPEDVSDSGQSLAHLDVTPTAIFLDPAKSGFLTLVNSSMGVPYLEWGPDEYQSGNFVNTGWNTEELTAGMIAAVPEPSTLLLALLATLGLSFYRRRRRTA